MRQASLDEFLMPRRSRTRRAGRSQPRAVVKLTPMAPTTPDNTGPCYLLSVVYDGKLGKAVVKLYDPERHVIYLWVDRTGHKPYFLTDLPPDKVRMIDKIVSHPSFDHVETVAKYDVLLDKHRVMTKVVMKDPQAVGVVRSYVPEAWEAKIKYHDNYIYDLGLIPGMLYRIRNKMLEPVKPEVSEEALKLVEELFKDEDEELRRLALEWLPLFETPPPDYKRVAMDIEVYTPVRNRVPDPVKASEPVISVAFASNDGLRKVLLLASVNGVEREIGKCDLLEDDVELEIFDDEVAMIMEAFRVIEAYPILITFNGDNFDLRYLYNRAQRLGIPRDAVPIKPAQDSMRLNVGIHIDLYRFFENRAIQVYAFGNRYREHTLDAIASALVGYHKIALEKDISELNLSELAAYNFRDAKLTLELTTFDKNLVMKLITLIMRISRMSMEDVVRRKVSAWIRNLFYWEHRRRNYLIPQPEEIVRLKGTAVTEAMIKGKKYAGAIVFEPKPGVYFNVVVLDFASLYPSIIKEWNLSYETVKCPHEECRVNKIPETGHWVCTKRRGLTSLITGLLRDFRVKMYKKAAKRKDLPEADREWYDVVQRAMKVYINASYGVFGSSNFPLYCPPAAESVTAIGRYAIKRTVEKATSLGLKVLYGDTDSLFIENPSPEAIEELSEWARHELGLDLEVDKVYVYVAFSGRKKNYLGLLTDGTVDVKGLVGKKKNTPEFLKKAFYEVVEALRHVKDQRDFDRMKDEIRKKIQETYLKLKNREYTLDELAFKVTLTKDLSEYTKSTPQHVKAALLLAREGIKVGKGDTICFVKVKSRMGVKPVQLAKLSEVAFDKYVDHIRTTFEQILDALNIDFDEILGAVRLESFFT